jgi:RNA polymerase sigma factor (sigma-70 family)
VRNTTNISKYLHIVEKVARVEYRRIPAHMVEYEELVSIGTIAIQALVSNKKQEEIDTFNDAYIATAIRWAIRNELRNRYKWYTFKHTKSSMEFFDEDGTNFDVSPERVREAVYETILSIDGISDASDGDTPFDVVRDQSAQPDERLEIQELGFAIRDAIKRLPPKERIIVEYRFYRNLQVKEIAAQVGLSSSRVTRIVQSSLNLVREYLKEKDHL